MSETTAIAEARTAPAEPDEQAAAPAAPAPAGVSAPDAEPQAEELLIEEVSIDGMCGVY
jgi:mycofactocin precursor